MALKKYMIVVALMGVLAASQTVNAQINVPSAEFEHRPIETPESTRPLATPGVFDYDAQVFAPFEFISGEEKEPNTGFYLTYDRTYTSIPRPGNVAGISTATNIVGNEFIWGTRIEFGWFTESDDGWTINFQNSEGLLFEAVPGSGLATPASLATRFATFEVNKHFRQRLHGGGYFEPYIGGQFININDQTQDITPGLVFAQEADNNVIGVHAGARYNRRAGRWRITSDTAIFTGYNQQAYSASDTLTVPPLITAPALLAEEDQSFVPALDLQFEIAYNVSRDFSIRGGAQLFWIFDGINRADTLPGPLNPNSVVGPVAGNIGVNSNDYVAAGFIFGFEWRR